MIFTRLGTVVAWLAAIMAAARIALGVYALTGDDGAKQYASRYLGTNFAAVIDQATIVFAFAIVLGVLVEISLALNRKQ